MSQTGPMLQFPSQAPQQGSPIARAFQFPTGGYNDPGTATLPGSIPVPGGGLPPQGNPLGGGAPQQYGIQGSPQNTVTNGLMGNDNGAGAGKFAPQQPQSQQSSLGGIFATNNQQQGVTSGVNGGVADGGGGGSAIGTNTGALGGTQPTINATPIFTGQQQQQAVNDQLANNITARDSRNLAARNELGASGFSGNSPQMSAIQRQNDVSRSIADQRARVDIPLQYNQANRQHMLGAQAAQEAQFRNRRQEELGRRGSELDFYAPILQQLFGMAGG